MSSSSLLVSIIFLAVGFFSEQQVLFASGFEFDHDVDAELCKKDTTADSGICTSNSTMWFSCPISCAQALGGGRGTMAEERSDPEQFYELHAKRMANGRDMSLEDNEGYITLYAVLPMLPGMAEYYFHAIEHIAQVYKYTLVAMVLPYYDTTNEQDDSIVQSIIESRNSDDGATVTKTKSILLTGHDVGQTPDNDVLEYLLTRDVVAESDQESHDDVTDKELLITRPNIFLVSHTGMFIERIVSPTMEMIERRIKVHELIMEDNFEL